MKRFALLALVVFASSCGKNDDSQVVAQPAGYTPPPAATPISAMTSVIPPNIQGAYPYFYVNYQVNEGHCTTGLRRFSGPHYQGVRSEMCASFRNNQMNQSCGHAQREAWFQAYCL